MRIGRESDLDVDVPERQCNTEGSWMPNAQTPGQGSKQPASRRLRLRLRVRCACVWAMRSPPILNLHDKHACFPPTKRSRLNDPITVPTHRPPASRQPPAFVRLPARPIGWSSPPIPKVVWRIAFLAPATAAEPPQPQPAMQPPPYDQAIAAGGQPSKPPRKARVVCGVDAIDASDVMPGPPPSYSPRSFEPPCRAGTAV